MLIFQKSSNQLLTMIIVQVKYLEIYLLNFLKFLKMILENFEYLRDPVTEALKDIFYTLILLHIKLFYYKCFFIVKLPKKSKFNSIFL